MKQYWLCRWDVGCEHYACGENSTFILFTRKRDAKKYFENANFEPYYEKISLESAKTLFGNYNYKII